MALVMGIINVTPDSFYADSRAATTADAIARGREFFDIGADIVDVGGESSRPGAVPVSLEEELIRVIDVITELAPHGRVSIDTTKPEVARAAVAAGATVINDVGGQLAGVAAELGVGYVLMHRQGDSVTMQENPHYDDVVAEVFGELVRGGVEARALGVKELWLDPGIGLGKSVEHNLALLAHLDDLVNRATAIDARVFIGTSRKRFIGEITHSPDPADRLEGSLATAALAIQAGAELIRVHDVQSAVQLTELFTRPIEEVTL